MPLSEPSPRRGGGLPLALGAYAIWGIIPLYFASLRSLPAAEMVAWRVMFTVPFCLAITAWRREISQLRQVLSRPRMIAILAASGSLIASNWLMYVFAVTHGHVLAASLGYYINPLFNVVAGTLFLREKLSRPQWLAAALAGTGVAVLAWGARDMLWISMTLALSFGTYGLVRKLAPVESLPGLTIEALLLAAPAAAYLAWLAMTAGGTSLGVSPARDLLIALSGPITGTPLLLFAAAARRMDYSTLGFTQYISPTVVFLLGLTVFGEPLRPIQLGCFVLIWTSVAVFSWDVLARRRKSR